MSDRARRLVRDAWDGKRGRGGGREKLFHVPSFHGFTSRFHDCAAQSFKLPTMLSTAKVTDGDTDSSGKKISRRSLKTQRNNICKSLAMNYTHSTIPCEKNTYPDCVRNVNASESFCRWLYRWNDERIKLDIGLISRC